MPFHINTRVCRVPFKNTFLIHPNLFIFISKPNYELKIYNNLYIPADQTLAYSLQQQQQQCPIYMIPGCPMFCLVPK